MRSLITIVLGMPSVPDPDEPKAYMGQTMWLHPTEYEKIRRYVEDEIAAHGFVFIGSRWHLDAMRQLGIEDVGTYAGMQIITPKWIDEQRRLRGQP